MDNRVFEKFADYLYDLLPSPWRQVAKDKNQWYLLCAVIGKRFDTVKKALETVRTESMIATCSECMLQIHADDRSLYRYQNEDSDTYRKRIAMYEATCRLGGTDQGVALAVRTLGYPVFLESARQYDLARWAEFYPVIHQNADEVKAVDPYIIRETVRKWKSVGARDRYLFKYEIYPEDISGQPEYNKLDGTYAMDGMIRLDASLHNEIIYNEELVRMANTVVTEKARIKMAEARHTTGMIPKVQYIALGTGGCMADGTIRVPLAEDVQLEKEILRKVYSGSEKKTNTCYTYMAHVLPEDGIMGRRISELALIDEEGDTLLISCFPPKEMVDGVENEFVIYDDY